MVIALTSYRCKVAFATSHPTTIPTQKTKRRACRAQKQGKRGKWAAWLRGVVALRLTHSSEERSCISNLPGSQKVRERR